MMHLLRRYTPIEKTLGYRFRRQGLLEMALTHPSFRHEQADAPHDNQRLEFLGDAVLDFLVAEHLYETYGDSAEGELTNLRSLLTNTKKLGEVGLEIGLGDHLRLGKGEERNGGRTRLASLGDAMEAIVGAAYLDGGVKAARRIVHHLLLVPHAGTGSTEELNPKGTLQEWMQRDGRPVPEYRLAKTSGPSHHRVYQIDAYCGNERLGSGHGPNKREAEKKAAAHALWRLRTGDPPDGDAPAP